MIINVDKVAAKIGIPKKKWTGRCYEIACLMVDQGCVEGEAVYGHWLGPVVSTSVFAGRPIVRHGWVRLKDGTVVDPTRWVFEGVEPYIFVGRDTGDGSWPYDEGGDQWRAALRRPPPVFNPERPVGLEFPSASARVLAEGLLGGIQGWSIEQVFWLANLPYAELGSEAHDIYAAIVRCGHKAAIPQDNFRRAQRERK